MLSFAPAKINLGLLVTEKRADGYHNIETVFYPVKLYDVVEVNPADRFEFRSGGKPIPADGVNLCEKAYRMLAEEFDLPPVQIDLLKNIPIGAGLGGGSSDAAHTLLLLNDLFRLNLSVPQLQRFAGRLGADCPFFIEKKPVFAHGIGADFEGIALDLSAYYIAIVHPELHISTAEAYQSIIPQTPTVDLRRAIQLPIQEWKFHLVNDFELGIFSKYPVIERIKHELYAAGAVYAAMSGSGSAVFGIFEEEVKLDRLESYGKVYYPIDL